MLIIGYFIDYRLFYRFRDKNRYHIKRFSTFIEDDRNNKIQYLFQLRSALTKIFFTTKINRSNLGDHWALQSYTNKK